MWRYANRRSGVAPRSFEITTIPINDSKRLRANETKVMRNATNRARTGIMYQRGLWARAEVAISFRLHGFMGVLR